MSAIIICLLIGLYYFFHTEPIANYPSRGTEIIAFGDSLVEGVGSTPGNDFVSLLSKKVGRPIVNLGISGNTTADGTSRIDTLNQYQPKIVILVLGGNDYLKKIPITETRKNLEFIIENIQARGAIVLLVGVQGGILNDHFDKEFKNLRDKYHTAFVSNILSGLVGHTQYMSDIVHPNDAGYRMMAERIYPILTQLLM
jgi:lysophospholipase L1-like esterase